MNLNLWTELHEWGTLKICVANISLFQLRFTGPEYNVTKSSLFWIYKCDEKPTNIFVKIETWIKPNILTKTKRQMRVVWSIVHCVCVCEREWVSVILNGRIWLYHQHRKLIWRVIKILIKIIFARHKTAHRNSCVIDINSTIVMIETEKKFAKSLRVNFQSDNNRSIFHFWRLGKVFGRWQP